jgi:ABC-type uncharacterized transport system permease subunit
VPFAVFFIVFQIAPLVWVLIHSVQSQDSGWGLANFSKIFSSKFYRQAIEHSLQISFWSSVFGIVIAVLGSYSLRKVDSRLRNFVNAFANMTSNFSGVPLAFAFIILAGLQRQHHDHAQTGGDHRGFQPLLQNRVDHPVHLFPDPAGRIAAVPGLRRAA